MRPKARFTRPRLPTAMQQRDWQRKRCSPRSRTRSLPPPTLTRSRSSTSTRTQQVQSVTHRGKGFRDKMIKLITTQTSHTKADIKVTGNPAYIAPDSPTSGKAIIINMLVPASPKDIDITNAAAAMLNRVKSEHVLGIFCSNEGTARAVISSTNDGSALPTQYPGLVVIGFDAGKAQKAAIRNKYFFGSITQDPVQYRVLGRRACLQGHQETTCRGRGHGRQVLRFHQHGSTRSSGRCSTIE